MANAIFLIKDVIVTVWLDQKYGWIVWTYAERRVEPTVPCCFPLL